MLSAAQKSRLAVWNCSRWLRASVLPSSENLAMWHSASHLECKVRCRPSPHAEACAPPASTAMTTTRWLLAADAVASGGRGCLLIMLSTLKFGHQLCELKTRVCSSICLGAQIRASRRTLYRSSPSINRGARAHAESRSASIYRTAASRVIGAQLHQADEFPTRPTGSGHDSHYQPPTSAVETQGC